MKIFLVAGARPNFMKIAPIMRELQKHPEVEASVVHTGQHYDDNMSDSFFRDLGIPSPRYNLGCSSGSQAEQTARVMVEFEKVCQQVSPDQVVVVGDVNSTIACGLTAKKLNVTLAHVEAGLRSGDRKMPEEINRLATDAITDLFFTTEKSGTDNLLREGQDPSSIHFVGHVMIDNLFFQVDRLKHNQGIGQQAKELKCAIEDNYCCMTLHRPSNVDNRDTLRKILMKLVEISEKLPIIFPCHPRTKKNITAFGLDDLLNSAKGLHVLEPLGYNDFLYLWKDATAVLTDSGGLQEETTALRVPCLTIRENTERPITVTEGSNILVGTDMARLEREVNKVMEGNAKKGRIPQLWDGKASERIVQVLLSMECFSRPVRNECSASPDRPAPDKPSNS